jgi:catechol 2,3-dioxygenase-like lactoylglutathione lyase family enzyme
MGITAGVHHIATATADMDRLIDFYAQVLDAPTVVDMREEGLRHVFIDLGGGTFLHPFEIPGVEVPQGELPMFGRGRIDHVGLRAETIEDFRAVRERIVRAGAGDGEVTDMGPVLSVGFNDPDGVWGEVLWDRRDWREGGGKRAAWQHIPYPDPIG